MRPANRLPLTRSSAADAATPTAPTRPLAAAELEPAICGWVSDALLHREQGD